MLSGNSDIPEKSTRAVGNMIRASLLMLVLFATAFCAENWDVWHTLSYRIGALPILVLAVVVAFAVAVYVKTREVGQLQDAIHALSRSHRGDAAGLNYREASEATNAIRACVPGDTEEAMRVLCDELKDSVTTMTAVGQMLTGAPDLPRHYECSVDALGAEICRTGNMLQNIKLLSVQERSSDVDLEEVINRVVSVRWQSLHSSDISATLDIQEVVPKVTGNADQLLHLMMTLFLSAENRCLGRKDGNGCIRVRLESSDRLVSCSISDNGPVAQSDSPSRSRNIDMLVSHAIATGHGGRIEDVTGSESGGLVRVMLPAARAE